MSKIDLSEEIVISGRYDDVGVDYANIFVSKADLIREALPILRELRQSILDEATKDKGWIASETSSSNLIDYCEALITSEDKD